MKETRVPVEYIRRLIEYAQTLGCDLTPFLPDCGLSQEILTTQVDIPARRYGEFYRMAILATQNEWFGIFSGGRVPLGAFRLMGLSILHCNSLEQAIIRAGEFSEICRGMHSRHLIERQNDMAVLSLAPIRAVNNEQFEQMLKAAPQEFILTSMLTWHRFSEWLIGEQIPILELRLMSSSHDIDLPFAYSELSNIQYACKRNELIYDVKFLDRPIVQNQDSLMAFLRTAPYHLVTQDAKLTSTADKVKSILKRDVGHTMPTAEVVASQLNVSVTTLRRQLAKNSTSFQTLKDETRMEAAFHFLSCLELSNNDIAQSLGFDEPSAFFRSFKKWTGQTPGEYRAQVKKSFPSGEV